MLRGDALFAAARARLNTAGFKLFKDLMHGCNSGQNMTVGQTC
jgi:hypothetical protein